MTEILFVPFSYVRDDLPISKVKTADVSTVMKRLSSVVSKNKITGWKDICSTEIDMAKFNSVKSFVYSVFPSSVDKQI